MSTTINVAVAVIHYHEQYLLGYRHASQHQGNRYEFVGGKIEADETPKAALMREVTEEIGSDLSSNLLTKLGVIRHDYPDKSVALHIFVTHVNRAQFDSLQHGHGKEGQAITWVDKGDLLANAYRLPAANARILDWLTLPETIYISQALADFADAQAWIDYYTQQLPKQAYCYLRPQTGEEKAQPLLRQLLCTRPDITPIIQYQSVQHMQYDGLAQRSKRLIVHLNHQQLMALDHGQLPTDVAYFASCHDQDSLSKINQLANTHTVMGCFLSPVLPTPTHPGEQGLGWATFAKLAASSDVPVYALGGMTHADLPTARQHGAWGVSGIRLIA